MKKIAYNKDRTMITHEGKLIRQYRTVDLINMKQLLEKKDLKDFDRDICLAMLPKQVHLLSLLMQDEELFLELIDRLIATCKDTGTSKEEALFFQRLLKIIQMPTRTLTSSLAEANDKINTDTLTYIKRFTTWL